MENAPLLPAAADPHWAAAAEGRLVLPHCGACGHTFFPPARLCSHCLADAVRWVDCDGVGTIEGWCTFHRPYYPDFWLKTPYSVILVRLDAGPHLYSNLLSDGAPSVGLRVKPLFTTVAPGRAVVQFESL